MGPQDNALEQVKLDAIKGTIRHFKNDVEDNSFEPAQDLDVVRRQLIAEHEGTLIDGEVVEDKKALEATTDAPKEKK